MGPIFARLKSSVPWKLADFFPNVEDCKRWISSFWAPGQAIQDAVHSKSQNQPRRKHLAVSCFSCLWRIHGFFCNYGFFYIGPIQEINATLERASSLPLPLPVESCPEDILEGTNLSGNLEVSQSGHEQLKSRWHQQQHQTDQTWYSTSLNPHLKLYLRPHFFLTFGLARAHLADFWRETQGLNGHFA